MSDPNVKGCLEQLRTYFDYLEAKYAIAPIHRAEVDERLRRLERLLAQSDAMAQRIR